MQVILIQDVPGTGRKGEIKEVSDGYGRNFLISKGLAEPATAQIIAKIENEKKQLEKKKGKLEEQSRQVQKQLNGAVLQFTVKAGAQGQIFGSVHEADVIGKIGAKYGMILEKRQITMPKHMKALGEYPFEVKLAPNLVAKPIIKLVSA